MHKPTKINYRRKFQDNIECAWCRDVTVKTRVGGLLWHAHVSELSDNVKTAIMQIKELKEVLNGQCEIIGFTLIEEVESMMCGICVD